MTFQNTIGNTAVTNVQSYLTHYTQDQTESYVQSAVMYHREIPFLYQVFEPTNVSTKKEKGGYKVMSEFILLGLPGAHIITDEAWDFSTPNGYQHHACLLQKSRDQSLHPNRLGSQREPDQGARPCLYCSRVPSYALLGHHSYLGSRRLNVHC